jgi:hypothetical protein
MNWRYTEESAEGADREAGLKDVVAVDHSKGLLRMDRRVRVAERAGAGVGSAAGSLPEGVRVEIERCCPDGRAEGSARSV